MRKPPKSHAVQKAARLAKRKKQVARHQRRAAHQLPSHWPRYTTPEYYSQIMEGMPADAIVADWSKHKPHNSYSPTFWYADQHNTCTECAQAFVFTKEEQRHWYEELKLPIQVQGTKCPECRRSIRKTKADQRQHMEEMAKKPRHPNEAFFRKRP